MKSLVCITPGLFEYEERGMPFSKDGHAIIKIKRIGVCGTDLHAYEGTQPFFNYPRILGHELAGDLVETGGAIGFEAGEQVTIIPYFNCGACIACRNGLPNCCTHIQVCGVHIDGGMVEYLRVPSYSLVHGNGLHYDELALIEPLAIGAHGIQRAGVCENEYVLLIGAGPIGICAMQFVHVAGAHVIAMDVNDSRLAFCKEHKYADHTINALSENITEQLLVITGGDMPSVIIDATGNQKAINNALQYLAHGGRFVLIGLQKGHISFSHPEFHKRETTLMSSRNATRHDFEHVITSVEKGVINPSALITHALDFDAVKDSFEGFLNPANHVIKAVIHF